MKARFITALLHISLEEDLGRGDKLDEVTFVTNNQDAIRSLLDREIVHQIGALEADAILKAGAVVYSTEELPDGADGQARLARRLAEVQTFENVLWLVRDNCVNNELGFLVCYDGSRVGVHSNFLSPVFTLANGKTERTAFSREELRWARHFVRDRILRIEDSLEPTTRLSGSVDRTARAMYHVQAARAIGDLGIKIASYCSALESLFATSQAELSHQLAERVASFLGVGPSDRLAKYKALKAAYSIRSRIVHGDVLKAGHRETLPGLSSECDGLVRGSLRKLFEDEEIRNRFRGSAEELDAFMISLLFGDENESLRRSPVEK